MLCERLIAGASRAGVPYLEPGDSVSNDVGFLRSEFEYDGIDGKNDYRWEVLKFVEANLKGYERNSS